MTDELARRHLAIRAANFWAESLWQALTALSVLMGNQGKIAIPLNSASKNGLSIYVKDDYLHLVITGEPNDDTTIN